MELLHKNLPETGLKRLHALNEAELYGYKFMQPFKLDKHTQTPGELREGARGRSVTSSAGKPPC